MPLASNCLLQLWGLSRLDKLIWTTRCVVILKDHFVLFLPNTYIDMCIYIYIFFKKNVRKKCKVSLNKFKTQQMEHRKFYQVIEVITCKALSHNQGVSKEGREWLTVLATLETTSWLEEIITNSKKGTQSLHSLFSDLIWQKRANSEK